MSSQENEIERLVKVDALGTMIVAHEGCCGCINITESPDSFEVVFICNECGKEIGRSPIPTF